MIQSLFKRNCDFNSNHTRQMDHYVKIHMIGILDEISGIGVFPWTLRKASGRIENKRQLQL